MTKDVAVVVEVPATTGSWSEITKKRDPASEAMSSTVELMLKHQT